MYVEKNEKQFKKKKKYIYIEENHGYHLGFTSSCFDKQTKLFMFSNGIHRASSP